MIKQIAFTAYPVKDMKRARDFYENVLGLPCGATLGDYWQEYDLGEGTFAIVAATDEAPEFYKTKGASIAFEVEDLDKALETMRRQNVPVIFGPMEFPACRTAVITDPDENVITLHQLAPAVQ